MLEDGRSDQEEVVNLSSYLFGRQVAVRWPCKSYWHWSEIHLVYPYSGSPCPFMKTCAICHRESPWLWSLINLSMWDGRDLLAQHLSGVEHMDSAPVRAKKWAGNVISILWCAPNMHLDNSIFWSVLCKICVVIQKKKHPDSHYSPTFVWFIVSVTFIDSPHFSSSNSVSYVASSPSSTSAPSSSILSFLTFLLFFFCTALHVAFHVSYSRKLWIIRLYPSWFPAHPNWQLGCRFDPTFY